ncbi:hypothetical protein A2U01_0112648, partial [Trifolium medium]|nr:hypothetical protein [Trifolium medium]
GGFLRGCPRTNFLDEKVLFLLGFSIF